MLLDFGLWREAGFGGFVGMDGWLDGLVGNDGDFVKL